MSIFSAFNKKINHLPGIDLLRGIAVLLVICRHWNVSNFLGHAGWMGVDLFFVLSGFLISGLLFSEYEKHGKIEFGRFFIRRGLKIYPLFYILIGITLIVYFFFNPHFVPYPVSFKNILAEILFIQNYYSGIYLHTWSLAIEEHFYLVLIICFFVLIKTKTLPGIYTLYTILILMASVFLLRLYLCYINASGIYFSTHTRIDSLLAGVAVSYIYRYKNEWLQFLYTRARYFFLALSIMCLSIFGFFEPNNLFTQSIGFNIIYCSCAYLLVYMLTSRQKNNLLIKIPAFIGFYSYPVYLVHIPVLYVFFYFGIEESKGVANAFHFLLYALASVGIGVISSEFIEQPVLRWRDKHLPSKA